MRLEVARLHARLGATMIYVTHDQIEAMTLADRIVVFNGGRVEQVGAPMQIYERPANLFVARFIGAPAMTFCLPRSIRRCATGWDRRGGGVRTDRWRRQHRRQARGDRGRQPRRGASFSARSRSSSNWGRKFCTMSPSAPISRPSRSRRAPAAGRRARAERRAEVRILDRAHLFDQAGQILSPAA